MQKAGTEHARTHARTRTHTHTHEREKYAYHNSSIHGTPRNNEHVSTLGRLLALRPC